RARAPVRTAIAGRWIEAAGPALADCCTAPCAPARSAVTIPIPAVRSAGGSAPEPGTAAEPGPQRGRRSGRGAKGAPLAARRPRGPGRARRLVVDPGPGRWPPDPQGLAVHFLFPEHGHLLVAAAAPGREPAWRRAADTCIQPGTAQTRGQWHEPGGAGETPETGAGRRGARETRFRPVSGGLGVSGKRVLLLGGPHAPLRDP